MPALRPLEPNEPRLLAYPWRITAAVAVLLNVAFGSLNDRIGTHPGVAEMSRAYPTLFTPAGYAFAIWGAIYAASLAYAVASLRRSQRQVAVHDGLARWLVLTNMLAALWVALFTREHLALSVLVIVMMLGASSMMFLRANHGLRGSWRIPFGLWLGWVSVATIANISVLLVAVGWSGAPSPTFWTVLMLAVAGALAVGISIQFRDATVPFVITWASLAISVARAKSEHVVAVTAGIVATISLIAAWMQLPKPRRARTPGALRDIGASSQNPGD